MRPAAVALLALAAAAAGCSGAGADRDDYVEANTRVLAAIPTYPGVTEVAERSSAYRGADGRGDARGYVTVRAYRLPAAASRGDVAAFYRARLGGWRLLFDQIEARGERVLVFCRAASEVGVNLENAGLVEVSADHDAFGKDGRPESCAAAERAVR